MNPEISVIMPVFNCGKYLAASLESMQAQTFKNFELIIIDDGSNDDSLEIIKSFAQRDQRIRFKSRPNTGICGALNDALALSGGDLIARMDGDDTCDPTRLEKQFAFMRQNPALVASGTGLLYMDPHCRPLYEMKPSTSHKEIMAEFLRGHSMAVTHATGIYQAGPCKAVGYRDKYNSIEDLDLFLRLSPHGNFGNFTEALYQYRQHPAGTNVKHFATQQRLRLELLTEYYSERQLGQPDVEFSGGGAVSLSDLYADWSCKAFLGGHRDTGLLYAFRFLITDGFSPKKIVRFGQMLKLAKN